MISMLSMSCRSVALDPVFHQLICDIVAYAEKFRRDLGCLSKSMIEQSLERCSANGDLNACHILGRSLAGYPCGHLPADRDRKSTRLNSSHSQISYAVFCLKKKKKKNKVLYYIVKHK